VILVTTRRGRRAGCSLRYLLTAGWNAQAVEYDRNMGLTYRDANSLFRSGPISEHTLQLNGASGAVDYTASISHRGEDGILRNSDYGGSSARAGVNAAVSDMLLLRANAWYSFSDAHRPLNDNNLTGMFGNTLIMGPVDAGAAGSYFFADSAAVQAVSDLTRSRRFTGSLEAVFTPHPSFTIRGLAGYDGLFHRTEQLYPAGRIYPAIGVMQGWKGIGENTLDRLNFDASASWSWSPAADFQAVTTAGGQAFSSASRGVKLYKSEFPNSLITNVGAGARLEQGDEYSGEAREAGIFVQQEFSWKEACFLSAGVRNDFASSIGEEAPSIFYPRAGAALRVDRLAPLPAFLPFMKLRAAYGESGILPAPMDAAGIRWGAIPMGTGTGAGIVFVGNPAIEPERVREFEAGVELQAWDFLGFDFTWYEQRSCNSVVAVMNPPSTGLTATATPRNVGAISGSGFEAEINARFFRTTGAQLDARLIWNHAVNEVKDLGNGGPIVEGVNAIAPGMPRFAFYAYPVTGAMFDQTGAYAGPAIDSLPRFLGTPLPENSGSFGVTLRLFRDLTFTALADFALGGTVHNRTRVYQALYNNDAEYNELATQLGLAVDYGIVPVPGVSELTAGSDAYRAAAERFARLDPTVPGATGYFESSDYFRLLELGLRYDFTRTLRSLMTQGFPKQLSLTLSARNLFMFTKYGGPDPNIESAGGRSIVRGRDFLTLQHPRVFTATMSIGL